MKSQADVRVLPGGHAIDLRCGVRYGIFGEPIPADQAGAAEPPAQPPTPIPDEARKQLVEALGGPFIIFRSNVQEDLKLAEAQKQQLLAKLPDYVQETMQRFEALKDAIPQEREQAMQEYRRKADAKLTALLKDVLDTKQQDRLFQVQLQQAGVFALLGQNPAFAKLKITNEQRQRFMTEVENMHKQIQGLVKEVESGGNPEEIFPKVREVRKVHAGRIEAILTDIQKKQWRELLGKPLHLDE
jgi:hypothetical protein